MEAIDNLTQYLYTLFFGKIFPFLNITIQISIITILQHQVIVICCLFHIVELNDVVTFTIFKHFDLTFQQLLKFTCIRCFVPFTFSRRIDLTAMSLLVALSYPLNTYPYCPAPIFRLST